MEMDPSRRNFLKNSVKAAIATAATKSSPSNTSSILPKESMGSKFASFRRSIGDADKIVKKVKPDSEFSKFNNQLDNINKPLDTIGDNVKMTRRQFLQSAVTRPVKQYAVDQFHQAGRTARFMSKALPGTLSNLYKSSAQKKQEKSSLLSRFGRFIGTESINSKVYNELQITLVN